MKLSKRRLAILIPSAAAVIALSLLVVAESDSNHNTLTVKDPIDGLQMVSSQEPTGLPPMSEANKKEYEKWQREGERHFGFYTRKLQELSGQLPASARRITLDEARALAEHNSFKNALVDMENIHGKPDYVGGSGVTIQQYWLDETGNKKIVAIIEQAEIFYDNGKEIERLN